MARLVFVTSVLSLSMLVSCSTDSTPPAVDAHQNGGQDGSGSNNDQHDGSNGSGGNVCTGAVYDPCTDPSQCDSGNCHLFQAQGFQVCTQACTPGDNTTCPGTGATCNNMGICKPAAANDCTPN